MYNLNQVGEHTYYMDSPTNVGFYVYNNNVCMIDGGNNKDAGKKALRHIEAKGWKLEKIICTHSHGDHTGGCALLKSRSGCGVYLPGVEASILNHTFLEPTYLYGGFAMKELYSKLITAAPCECMELSEDDLPEGLCYEHLDGHSFEQIAVRTDDGVWFTGDCVLSAETLNKYKVSFLYDIEKHLKSLEKIKTLSGKLFIPSHNVPVEDITELAEKNRENVAEVSEVIKRLCSEGITIDGLLEKVFEEFSIKLYITQYALIGFTVRSYISWLYGKGEIEPVFEGTKLLWKTV